VGVSKRLLTGVVPTARGTGEQALGHAMSAMSAMKAMNATSAVTRWRR
jgi:hypothetical protein